MNKIINQNKGITLIALVITIIVLLILAGISIMMITGENSIIRRTISTREKSDVGAEKEQIAIAMTAAIMKGGLTQESIQEELDKMLGENVGIVYDNGDNTFDVEYIDKNHTYKIENETVMVQDAKIRDKKIIVKDGNQEIKFENTINQVIVDSVSGKKNAQYEILGISSDGENYSTTAEGKTGTLAVQGDIKNSTFKYTLNNFMQGDETFFVKYSIEGVEQVQQKLQVIQGETIRYEEDFIGFDYQSDGWTDAYNENFSGGKAKMASNVGNIVFANLCATKVTVISVADLSVPMYLCILDNLNGQQITKSSVFSLYFDGLSEEPEYGVELSVFCSDGSVFNRMRLYSGKSLNSDSVRLCI